MKRRLPLVVLAVLGLFLLTWWMLRSPEPSGDDGGASVAGGSVTPARIRTEPLPIRERPGVSPAVHLPQIQAGPNDIDPDRRGPSNLPPGTQRTRYAGSGKLAHYVIEEYADSFRECFEQHRAEDPELPTRALLEFTISAEPRDTGNQYGTVREVQVLTGGPDYDLMEHNAFEFCCTEAVIQLQLDPPGGREGGEMRFGMTIDLDRGELVDENRGQGQAQ